MTATGAISQNVFDKLRGFDSCAISNAIERLDFRLRNEGFIAGTARCRVKTEQPMLGYAVTGRIRSSAAPLVGHCYYQHMDFWRYVAKLSKPTIMVFEDVDVRPGFGAFVGEIHASIGQTLGCIGYITNGAVRDLPALRQLGFYCYSGSVSVSHAYAHLVDFGDPVQIGGLRISTGDLLHGDLHGVVSVPKAIAALIPEEADAVLLQEEKLKEYCRSPEFTLDGLDEIMKETSIERLCLRDSK